MYIAKGTGLDVLPKVSHHQTYSSLEKPR